jgi:hypothetical protein
MAGRTPCGSELDDRDFSKAGMGVMSPIVELIVFDSIGAGARPNSLKSAGRLARLSLKRSDSYQQCRPVRGCLSQLEDCMRLSINGLGEPEGLCQIHRYPVALLNWGGMLAF